MGRQQGQLWGADDRGQSRSSKFSMRRILAAEHTLAIWSCRPKALPPNSQSEAPSGVPPMGHTANRVPLALCTILALVLAKLHASAWAPRSGHSLPQVHDMCRGPMRTLFEAQLATRSSHSSLRRRRPAWVGKDERSTRANGTRCTQTQSSRQSRAWVSSDSQDAVQLARSPLGQTPASKAELQSKPLDREITRCVHQLETRLSQT